MNSPEQRRLGIRDSFELAWQDWQGTAGFDRLEDEDTWGYQWTKAYVRFATEEKYDWLKNKGIRLFPVVGWAERRGSLAGGHGNSVPRFHITWGTGPAIIEPFVKQVLARDREMENAFSKDAQVTAIHSARQYVGGKLIRVAKPHRLLDPQAGPLIAVRLNILTRKTLVGLQTNLNGQVLNEAGQEMAGLYAVGEVCGFGGGGMHGYRSLEGTFLGGCLFTGKIVDQYLATR